MDEAFYALLGCSVVFGIPALVVWLLVRLHRRVKNLEMEVLGLRETMHAGVAEARSRSKSTAPTTPTPATEPPAVKSIRVDPSVPAIRVAPSGAPESVAVPPNTPETSESEALASAKDLAAASELESREPVSREASSRHGALQETDPRAPAPPKLTPAEKTRSAAKVGWEEQLWTRLPVWLGAIAVALGAAYLVKYSFEQGWISPRIRVVFGVLLGVGLLVGGERLRKSSSYVAQGLSASGIAALFVSFFAAVNLYQLMPAWLGFVFMALTTAVAVALSLRQGFVVATVGLVGGFLTPALVSPGDHHPGLLFSYLLLLQVGLVWVTRRQRWWLLGALSLAAGLSWTLGFLGSDYQRTDAIWVGLFLLSSVSMFAVTAVAGRADGSWGSGKISTLIGWSAMVGGLLTFAGLASAGSFGTVEWLFLGLISAGCLALARFDDTFHGLAWLAPTLVTLLLAAWLSDLGDLAEPALARFLWTEGLLGALFVVGAYVAHFGSRRPGAWASLSSAAAVVYLLLPATAPYPRWQELHWGIPALLLGALFVVMARPVAARRRKDEALARPLAALAVGATTLLSLAVPLELERQWLTVAWSVEVFALLWLAGRLRLPALEVLAAVLGSLVGIRLLLNPEVLSYPIGQMPIFNWLLYGYGVPILAIGASAWLAMKQNSKPWLQEGLQWLWQGLALAFLSLQVRQYFFPGALDSDDASMTEWATYTIVWLLFSCAQHWLHEHWLHEQWPSRPLLWGRRATQTIGVLVPGILLSTGLSPLYTGSVGAVPIVNRILWSFGVPAALMLWLARDCRQRQEHRMARFLAIAGLATVFMFVTLQVRQAFHGTSLVGGGVSIAENYTYSFAWIVLGSLTVIAGIVRQSRMLRYASLVMLVPAVFKVFLFDTAHLTGLYRAASLLGLGFCLFLLAYLYRRFVFTGEAGEGVES